MAFTPKDQSTILRNLISLVTNRTELNDITPGSVLFTLLSGVANELSATERRIKDVRDGFSFDGLEGSDLDERVQELPIGGILRRGATAASGAVLRIERDGDLSGSLTIPAGSSVENASSGVRYETVIEVIIPANQSVVEDILIKANVVGQQGNALAGEIATIVSMPNSVFSAINTRSITNAQEEESDSSLRRRANKYIESLSRTQPSALEFVALSFTPSDNSKFTFASVFENPSLPAYSELVVDDGSGIAVENVSRLGREISGTVPAGGVNILYHEAPATEALTAENITITRGGVNIPLNASQFTSIPERGVVYFNSGVLQEDDEWTISGYSVFSGAIAELQREIEGTTSDANRITGFRAAGCRVRVVPPEVTRVSFDLGLKVGPSYDISTVGNAAIIEAEAYVSTLTPGETLYVSRIIDAIMGIDGVVDVKVYRSNTYTPYDNISPISNRSVIRTSTSSIKAVASR